jgi:hypothetical protein
MTKKAWNFLDVLLVLVRPLTSIAGVEDSAKLLQGLIETVYPKPRKLLVDTSEGAKPHHRLLETATYHRPILFNDSGGEELLEEKGKRLGLVVVF